MIPNGDEHRYRSDTPKSWTRLATVPLVVAFTAARRPPRQEQAISRYDRLAERKGFVVLDPDVDAAGRQPGPGTSAGSSLDRQFPGSEAAATRPRSPT